MSDLSLNALAIGSLPNSDTTSAMDIVRKNFKNIPFWPQLSKVNSLQDMTVQYSERFPGLEIDIETQTFSFNPETEEFAEKLEELYSDYFEIVENNNFELLEKYAINPPYTTTIQPFLDIIRETKPKYAKGQIIGPFTWGTMLTDSDNRCLFYDETYRDIIVKLLALKALWQVKNIQKANPETVPIIFMDEPTMSQIGTSAFLTVKKSDITDAFTELCTIIRNNGGLSAIHCCGKADWDMILQCKPDIINFDAYSFNKNILTFSKSLKPFVENGGYIAWGIVPTLDKDSLEKSNSDNLISRLEEIFNSMSKKGIDKNRLIQQSIISPSCGAGGLELEQAEYAMNLTNEISKKLKEKYGVAE